VTRGGARAPGAHHGKTVSVAVTAFDADGLAVGALDDDRRVHVKGVGRAAVGASAEVDVQVVKRRRGAVFGIVEGRAAASAAACRAYPRCGGCAIQHLGAREQIALKRDKLVSLLVSAGVGLDAAPTIVSGPQYHYRRRARLGVRHLRDRDETLVGFRESFGSRIARIDACLVLVEPLATALPPIRRAVAQLDACARVPQVELAAGDDAGAVVVRHLDPLSDRDRAALLALERDCGLEVCVQGQGLGSIARVDGAPSRGLRYRLDRFGVALAFSPSDFVQVNGDLNRELVATAVTLLAPARGAAVADLFSGIGNFALPLARVGAQVTAIDSTAALASAAQRNANTNGLGARVEVLNADLYGPLAPEVVARLARVDAALVDPPRTGLGPVVSALAAAERLSRVVYASCDAQSFARDAAQLDALGFSLSRVYLFDMFPHTGHAETLALLERR